MHRITICLVSVGLTLPIAGRSSAAEEEVNPDVVSELIAPSTLTGDFRFYDFRRWHDQNQPYPTQPYRSYDSQGTAIGGDLKFKSGEWAGFSGGLSLFTQHSIVDYASPNAGLFTDPDVTQIAEAYGRFQVDRARFTVGRQLMNTPFANTDMYTMLTRSFQGFSAGFNVLGDAKSFKANDQMTNDVLAPFKYDSKPGAPDLKVYLARMTRYQNRYSSDFTAGNRYSLPLHTLDPSIPIDTPGLSAAGIEYRQGLSVGDILARGWAYTFFDYAHLQFLESGFQLALLDNARPFLRVSYAHENQAGAAYVGRVDAEYIGAKLGLNFPVGSIALVAANAPRHVGAFRNGALLHPYNDLSDVLYDDTIVSGLEDLGPGRALGINLKYKYSPGLALNARYVHYVAYYGTNGSVYSYGGPLFFSNLGLLNGQLVTDQASYAYELGAKWQLSTLAKRLKGLSVSENLALRGGYNGASKFIDNRLQLVYAF